MRLSKIMRRTRSYVCRRRTWILLISGAVLYFLIFGPAIRQSGDASNSVRSEVRASASHKVRVWMNQRPLSELRNNAVPNLVFFVWCQNRTFTFQDYLSVLSAWKLMEPDSLELHRGTDAQEDKYNSWLSVLNRTIPSFVVSVIPGSAKERCKQPLQYALEVLSDRGGIYMNTSTLLTRPIHHLRKVNFTIGLSEYGTVSFIASQIKSPMLRTLNQRKVVSSLQKSGNNVARCPTVYVSVNSVLQVESSKTHVICLTLPSTLSLKPLDLNSLNFQALAVLRDLFYMDIQEDRLGDRGIQPTPIPKIVHYVWFGSSEMSFRMYLSILSTLHVFKADEVFIHTENNLRGYYWQKVSTHPKVTVVYREPPRTIFGHRILYTQHRSDIVRADVLDKYGGVYMDWDVLWLRSPSDLLDSDHEAVVSLDHMPRPPYPDSINLGVFMASPRSRFVRLWRRELRHYRPKDFFYNALELPYKVYETRPDTLHVDGRLQVMCYWLKCHPSFHPDFKNWHEPQPFDWRTDVYAIHFTHPDPKEFDSVVELLNGNGTFADIGKFILRRAGELD